MFPRNENQVSDLHVHLNGSFSLAFLKKIATQNNADQAYDKLITLKQQYNDLREEKATDLNQQKLVGLIFAQFSPIHQIIQKLSDIQIGTVDVIEQSKAGYLEIRTTPKPMEEKGWEQYVEAFVNGLKEGNRGKKIAHGLLSLDRTLHNEETSKQIVDCVVAEKRRHGLLIGIDISGDPTKPRQLTGEGLRNVLLYTLAQPIGIAIHIGEADNPTEKADVDIILEVLSAWRSKNVDTTINPFFGKIRLGHAIFLTKEQQSLIHQLQIPIEVCPTCHEKLDWVKKNKNHPVKNIFPFWKHPIASGTDDTLLFDCDAEGENLSMLRNFDFSGSESTVEEARIHQSQFRFTKGR